MGLEVLQARLRANELEFAKLNGISLDAKPEIKPAAKKADVKKTELKKTPGVKKSDDGGKKMPGNNNPWAGELASRRKKSSVGRQTSEEAGEYDEEEDGEWEWEEEEEAEDKPDEEATGKANITIDGSLVKIDRSKVDWSDDEFEEEEEDEKPKAIPAPPPPPPAPPAPPPPPPPPGLPPPKKAKSDRVEALKKRPTKRPDWNDLMQEIEKYRCKSGMLKKCQTNDRSKPMLSKSKVKGVFVYESEKNSKEADILKEISQGAKLKHVRCNDRSKPNLKGIKTFKRQLTKEEKDKKGFSFGEDALEEDLEDVTKIKDDLESTKQLLELEVRSKSLLEKDNKKLQAEIERLKDEFQKMQDGGQPAPEIMNSILSVRKDSVSKEGRRRKSSVATVVEVEEDTDMATEEEKPEKLAAPAVKSEEVIEEMEELKEEVDEARKLAEEWEAKYKEMQRQMSLLEEGTPFGKKNSTTGFERPVLQRGLSTTSSDGAGEEGAGDKRTSQNLSEMETVTGDDWMQKREVQQLRAKLKNVKDKKEMIVRERVLLTERVDSLKDSIAIEYEARKKLKKDVKDMNAAFKEEMEDMELDEDAQNDLDDCYFENEEDLVINSHRKKKDEDDDMDEYADFGEDDDLEESVEEIIKNAEESEEMEVDPGEDLFNKLKEEVVEDDLEDISHEKQMELLNKRVEEETEKVQTMRKSNFSVKAKIDILYDLLQTQKEKHYDLKQELNRMLSDIQ